MKIALLAFLFLFTLNATAQVIVTTLPEFAWAAQKLLPKAKVKSLLNGSEDPHYVDASPSFLFKAAKADVLIYNGLSLEVGWLPKVLEQSGNSKIQFRASGNCNASLDVQAVGKLKTYDRSMGDLHPMGNPHYTLSLIQMKLAVNTIAQCLSKLNMVDKGELAKNLGRLNLEFDQKTRDILKIYKTKEKLKVYVFHREFSYLVKDLGLDIMASLEKVPGVLPSATYLTKLASKAKKDKPVKVLGANTASQRILAKFKELSGVKYITLTLHPRPNEDYFTFIEKTYTRIFE